MKPVIGRTPFHRVEHPEELAGEEHTEREGGEQGQRREGAEHGKSHAAARSLMAVGGDTRYQLDDDLDTKDRERVGDRARAAPDQIVGAKATQVTALL